jgi:hypothetical protein
MTFEEAEKVRERTGLDPYAFSKELGFSYATYYGVTKRRRISRGVEAAIEVRFGKFVKELRKQEVAV